MEKHKEIQLELLINFHGICIENNLRYSLAYGTLLGTIRHNGFIPWDDDIDIIMPREDYEKFCEIYPNDHNVFLQNYKTDNNYPFPFAKLRNSLTTWIEENVKDIDMNHGIFIDIFPFDKISKNRIQREFLVNKAQIIWILCMSNFKTTGIKGIAAKLIRKTLKNRTKTIFLLVEQIKKSNRIIRNYNYSDLSYGRAYANYIYSSDIFDSFIEMEFEGYKFMCISKYDEMLTMLYGDYMEMPPLEERVGKHNGTVDCNIEYGRFIKKKN